VAKSTNLLSTPQLEVRNEFLFMEMMGSVNPSFLFEKYRFAPQEKPRIRHRPHSWLNGFTRTTFRNCALPHDAFGVSDRCLQSLLLKVETSKRTHDSRGFAFAELNPSIQLNAVPERTGSHASRCSVRAAHGC
jgi:hypothetical protein